MPMLHSVFCVVAKQVLLIFVASILVMCVSIAAAQTETVLYSFCTLPNCTDGAFPDSQLILDAHGNLYGETYGVGAYGAGTVFELTPSGTEIVLHNFSDGLNAHPWRGLVQDAKGNLYGTNSSAYYNGSHRYSGAVFALLGKKKFLKHLYRFAEADPVNGEEPSSALIMDAQGNLYGTTFQGGILDCNSGIGCGVVFEITAPAAEKVLYAFAGGVDGDAPNGGLVMDAQANLYGTTIYGGNGLDCWFPGLGCGTVFKLTPDGTETVLHSFAGGSDGGTPIAGLVMDSGGNLYGTTTSGGSNSSCTSAYGCGTVFKLTPDGVETVLYSFGGGMDGDAPSGTLVLDGEGNLYGVTTIGGGSGCDGNQGCGTVFRVSPSGEETVLHRFAGPPDGAFGSYSLGGTPLVFDTHGNLYGTTSDGGTVGCGTVFKVTP